ncbi:hypothetical protein MY11210_007740 [Beauveria gryllotalpidicola]
MAASGLDSGQQNLEADFESAAGHDDATMACLVRLLGQLSKPDEPVSPIVVQEQYAAAHLFNGALRVMLNG